MLMDALCEAVEHHCDVWESEGATFDEHQAIAETRAILSLLRPELRRHLGPPFED
jgi:hypothetical protein